MVIGDTDASCHFIYDNGALEIDQWYGNNDITLLYVALNFAYIMFGEAITYVIDSFCKTLQNGHRIPLSYYYILNYNTTWYESACNASPVVRVAEYKAAKEELAMYLRTPKPTFEHFTLRFNMTNQQKKQLKCIYDISKTIGDFIKKVENYNPEMFKGWLSQIVETFVPGLHFKTWKIPVLKNEALIQIQILGEYPEGKIAQSDACMIIERHTI
jgi:hypothetical protein